MPGGADHVADLSGKGSASEASGRAQPRPAAETPRDSVETESYGTVKLGGIEGHANRIKSLTRQTFERAKVELLRRQVPLHG